MDWSTLKPIELSKVKTVQFPQDQYFPDIYEKRQIVLHHTIGASAESDIQSWEDDPAVVAVCIIIDRAGTPWQLFSSKCWAYHLGAGNHDLDKHSIGIEIDNWGWLVPGDGTVKQFGEKSVQTITGKYYSYYGYPVTCPMTYYPNGFRGYNYYETYYDAQLQTLGELLLYWKERYTTIPMTYNESMWDVSQEALSGTPGIWTHVSYLPAPIKYDCHPQSELISLLQTLNSIS